MGQVKAAIKKKITYEDTNEGITAHFFSETTEAKRQHCHIKVLQASEELYSLWKYLWKLRQHGNLFRQTKAQRIYHQETSIMQNAKEFLQTERKCYVMEKQSNKIMCKNYKHVHKYKDCRAKTRAVYIRKYYYKAVFWMKWKQLKADYG